MKKIITLLCLILFYHISVAQVWTVKNNFTGGQRSGTSSFAIGDTGYVTSGSSGFTFYNDTWKYNPTNDSWTQIANYPGVGGGVKVGFSAQGKGYVGTGTALGYAWYTEFYSYNPDSDKWDKKADFPGIARGYAVGFSLDGKGYIGCGVGGPSGSGPGSNFHAFKDFYCYDPVKDSWTQIANYPGKGSQFDMAFVIGDKAYVGGGETEDSANWSATAVDSDFWEYDTTSKVWSRIADFAGGPRDGGTAFSTCDKGFVGLGDTDLAQQVNMNDFWQYDPATNAWTQVANYGGAARFLAASFIIGNQAYAGLGNSNSLGNFDDWWQDSIASIPAFTTANSTSTTICNGELVSFKDTSNYAPTNWFWNFTGATPDTSTMQNPTVVYNTPGTYSVTLSAWNGCDSGSTTIASYITVNPSPAITITPANPQLCAGQSVTLVASGYSNYQWVGTTDTTDSITVSPVKDTSYELIASNGTCAKDTFIEVRTGGILTVTIQPQSQTICAGQSINLKAAGGYTYNWNPSTGLNTTSGDSVVATPSASVTYTVTAMDTLGCSGTGVDTITVVPVPNTPTISQHGDTLVSSASTDNQWYLNGTAIAGATGSYLIIGNSTGVYTVAVENPADGCTSNSMPDTTAGINQLSVISNQISIYPNPTNGNLYININSSALDIADWNLRLSDVLGQTIYTRNSLDYTNVIDLSELAAGVYFIIVTDKTDEGVFKVMKQ